MGWKDLSSPFKGAIIGAIIGIIIGIVMIFVVFGIGLGHDCLSSAQCPFSIWENAIFIVSGIWLSSSLNNILPDFLQIALIPIHYLVYGILIGWIFGKIKSR
jgi:hypothetical protein